MIAFLSSSTTLFATNLATVGKKKITDSDLKAALGSLPSIQRTFLNKNVIARTRLVENLVMEKLFAQEAVKLGLNKRAKFKADLARRRADLLAAAYVTEEIDKKLSDSSVRSYYNKNRQRYRTDEVRASHVLVKTKSAANEVYKKAIKADNEAFKALAKKHSTDPSASRNLGDLGFFTRTRMVPEFSDVAFKLKKGGTSKPVKTAFGWHVIRVVDKKKGKDAKFASVKQDVKNHLRQSLLSQLAARLKKENGVVINNTNIQKLQL